MVFQNVHYWTPGCDQNLPETQHVVRGLCTTVRDGACFFFKKDFLSQQWGK